MYESNSNDKKGGLSSAAGLAAGLAARHPTHALTAAKIAMSGNPVEAAQREAQKHAAILGSKVKKAHSQVMGNVGDTSKKREGDQGVKGEGEGEEGKMVDDMMAMVEGMAVAAKDIIEGSVKKGIEIIDEQVAKGIDLMAGGNILDKSYAELTKDMKARLIKLGSTLVTLESDRDVRAAVKDGAEAAGDILSSAFDTLAATSQASADALGETMKKDAAILARNATLAAVDAFMAATAVIPGVGPAMEGANLMSTLATTGLKAAQSGVEVVSKISEAFGSNVEHQIPKVKGAYDKLADAQKRVQNIAAKSQMGGVSLKTIKHPFIEQNNEFNLGRSGAGTRKRIRFKRKNPNRKSLKRKRRAKTRRYLAKRVRRRTYTRRR